jgi:uncharacterized coiled-coil protein SlyX
MKISFQQKMLMNLKQSLTPYTKVISTVKSKTKNLKKKIGENL